MRALSEKHENMLEAGLERGHKTLMDFIGYQGTDRKYWDNAKVGGLLVGAWLKARATETNRILAESSAQATVESVSRKRLQG